jgi:hypothetical protein
MHGRVVPTVTALEKYKDDPHAGDLIIANAAAE